MREEPLPWPSYACSAPPREINVGAAVIASRVSHSAGVNSARRRFSWRCLIGDVLWSCAGSTRKAPRWDGVRRFTGDHPRKERPNFGLCYAWQCAQSRAARIAGFTDSPASGAIIARLPAIGRWRAARQENRTRPAAADLAVQIVDHLLRIRGRRRLAAAPNSSPARHQLLLPVADHRRMNPKLRRQLRQGLLPRKRRHRHPRFELRAVLLPLYAHFSRPGIRPNLRKPAQPT
jgi:hypothetical protein